VSTKQECTFILLYYSKKNNFLHNLNLCSNLGVRVSVAIDYPKHNKTFIKTFSQYKEILKIIKEFPLDKCIISNKFDGFINYIPSKILLDLINGADNFAIVSDDFIITEAFIKFVHTIIKEKDFIQGTGINFFEKSNKHFYTKTDTQVPNTLSIYNSKTINLKANEIYMPKTDLVFKNLRDENSVINSLPKYLNYNINFLYLPNNN